MKLEIFLGIIFLISRAGGNPIRSDPISEDMPEVLLETISQSITCSRETSSKITPADINAAQNSNLNLPENSQAFNEYFGCIWKKKGIIDDDGNIDEERLERHLVDLFTMGREPTEAQIKIVDRVMSTCKGVEGESYGQKSVKVHNCILDLLHKLANGSERL